MLTAMSVSAFASGAFEALNFSSNTTIGSGTTSAPGTEEAGIDGTDTLGKEKEMKLNREDKGQRKRRERKQSKGQDQWKGEMYGYVKSIEKRITERGLA